MATTEISPEGCTIDTFTVASPGMGREIKAVVVLPPEYQAQHQKHYPVLYTFHGMGAPHDTFSQMVPLRSALRDKPMIVTCFDADSGSFYVDSPFPQKAGRNPQEVEDVKSHFTQFFFDEFIPAIDHMYRVDHAKRMLTGFSMGGFGSLHYYLTRPSAFVSVSALSGWFESFADLSPFIKPIMENIIGPYAEKKDVFAAHDLFERIKKQAAANVPFAPIYLACGTEDFLLAQSREMDQFLAAQGIAHEYVETGGAHDWPYWREASAGVVDFHWRTLPR